MPAPLISELSNIRFTKMSGSGNDFIVIDNRQGELPAALAGEFTRLVSRRRLSIGADGVVLIERATGPEVDFDWRYINADGSDGEMCGNGAMCGARFATLHEIAPPECAFLTPSGVVKAVTSGERDDPAVRIAIAQPGPVRHGVAATIGGIEIAFSAIQVGVPHAVAIVPDADRFPDGMSFNAFGRETRCTTSLPQPERMSTSLPFVTETPSACAPTSVVLKMKRSPAGQAQSRAQSSPQISAWSIFRFGHRQQRPSFDRPLCVEWRTGVGRTSGRPGPHHRRWRHRRRRAGGVADDHDVPADHQLVVADLASATLITRRFRFQQVWTTRGRPLQNVRKYRDISYLLPPLGEGGHLWPGEGLRLNDLDHPPEPLDGFFRVWLQHHHQLMDADSGESQELFGNHFRRSGDSGSGSSREWRADVP